MADRIHRDQIFAHQEWLGFVQPVGLVVSPTVMVKAQVIPDRNISHRQREFRELLKEDRSKATARWVASSPREIFQDYLEWEEGDLVDATDHSEELEIALPELDVVLSPTWAVPSEDSQWTMLIQVEENGVDLDKPPANSKGWNATLHSRFERLLRETGIPTGLLCTNECIRLVYAPKGESSGHATFEFSQMALPAGRPILSAFEMLLSAQALFMGPLEARLPALLAQSREAQAEVSTQLSRQVLTALYELLRGFIAGEARRSGRVTELAWTFPDHLYGGLITTLMRLIFILYAEDRGLMPDHSVYQQHYSLGGLFMKLRADKATWPDTMDQRYGAWAQLLSLFRLIHNGGSHAELKFVARKGTLFDPRRFPFLEGRPKRRKPVPQDGSKTGIDANTPLTGSGGSVLEHNKIPPPPPPPFFALAAISQWFPTRVSGKCWSLSWCLAASGCPTVHSTLSRLARSTRRSWDFGLSSRLVHPLPSALRSKPALPLLSTWADC